MQNQGNIQRSLRGGRRLSPVQLQQETSRVRERSVGFNHVLTLADAVVGSYDHRDLRSEPDGLIYVCVVVILLLGSHVESQRRNRCAQHIHWQGFFWYPPQEVDNRRVKMTLFRQPFP